MSPGNLNIHFSILCFLFLNIFIPSQTMTSNIMITPFLIFFTVGFLDSFLFFLFNKYFIVINIKMVMFTKFGNYKNVKEKIIKTQPYNPRKWLFTCQALSKNLSLFSVFPHTVVKYWRKLVRLEFLEQKPFVLWFIHSLNCFIILLFFITTITNIRHFLCVRKRGKS